jgi:hypothetical protein
LVANQRFPDARCGRLELGLRRVDLKVGFDRRVWPVLEVREADPRSGLELGGLNGDRGRRVVCNHPLDSAQPQVDGAVFDGRPIDVASEALKGQVESPQVAIPVEGIQRAVME